MCVSKVKVTVCLLCVLLNEYLSILISDACLFQLYVGLNDAFVNGYTEAHCEMCVNQ